MVQLIDKKDCQFDNIFCHKIIQYRNKFLIDNHFHGIQKLLQTQLDHQVIDSQVRQKLGNQS